MNKFVPLRSFIFDRLYNPAGGYFCRKDFQVGELSSTIDFKSLIGFDDYQQQLFKKYPKNAWLTPSEVFKPYYGMSIGNYIEQAEQRYLRKRPGKSSIKIVQAGAGTGSAAESILFYFQNFSQQHFKNIQYHIVQISPILCEHAQKKLKKGYPRLFERGQIKIFNKDINKYTNTNRCYTIFLQVLDNLPHDKVRLNQITQTYDTFSTVNLDSNQQKYQNIEKDTLVKECLDLYLKYQKFNEKNISNANKGILDRIAEKILQKYYLKKTDTKQLFLPTQMLQLIKNLKTNIPQSHAIMSDFDSLVSKLPGIGAPIVSFKGQKSADKKDYDTFLVNRGTADIFFPVNFGFLKYLHGVILGRQADAIKSYDFFEQFGVQNWTNSKSGFNPLKQDFGNTSFLISKV